MKFALKLTAATIAGITPGAICGVAGMWLFSHNVEALQYIGFGSLVCVGGVVGYLLAQAAAAD